MVPPRLPLRGTAALSALLFIGATAAGAQPLEYDRALALALERSPELAAQAASLRAAEDETQAAGSLPPPRLAVGVDNFPVSGPMRGTLSADFMTMRKLGLMQELPATARRAAQRATADAAVELVRADRRVARWKVRLAAAQAWLACHYLGQQRELLADLAAQGARLATVLPSQVGAGRAAAAEVPAQQLELSRIEDRQDELAGDLARAAATLRGLVGAIAPVEVEGEPPVLSIDPEELRQHLYRHPQLQAFSAQSRTAQAQVREASAQRHPDWSVELAYARRGPQFGDMVSLQVTMTLPTLVPRRVDPMVASRREQGERAEQEHEALRRELAAGLEADLAERNALQRQATRAGRENVALAAERVTLLTARYGAGNASLTEVLAARREWVEQRLRALDLDRRLAALTAQLYYTYATEAP